MFKCLWQIYNFTTTRSHPLFCHSPLPRRLKPCYANVKLAFHWGGLKSLLLLLISAGVKDDLSCVSETRAVTGRYYRIPYIRPTGKEKDKEQQKAESPVLMCCRFNLQMTLFYPCERTLLEGRFTVKHYTKISGGTRRINLQRSKPFSARYGLT